MGLAVVTGANRGIGLELARLLEARGPVLAAVRKSSPELAALAIDVVQDVDVSTDAGVQRLRRAVGERPVELLINNAGILVPQGLDDLDFAETSRMLEVNAVGPLRVVAGLRHNLRSGSKVGIVTSRMGSMADNTSGGAYGYRMSKAAVNAAGVSLARDLQPAGVAVALLHPGWVRTEMTRGQGLVDAPAAAAGLLARLDELTLETSGGFWHANGEALPW